MNTQIWEKAKKIKAMALDGDGVIFTGHVLEGLDGGFGKIRSHADGQGISLLRAAGIRIALCSGEKTGFIEVVGEKLNALPSVKEGKWPPIGIFTGPQGKAKVESVDQWLKDAGLTWEECAYMGDDLSDYEILQKVGFASAPAQAEDVIKKLVHYVALRRGGDGAIRDLANLILDAKGVDVTVLSLR